MIGFEISIDDQRVCTAGIGDLGALSVIATWVRRVPPGAPSDEDQSDRFEEELTLDVAGLARDVDGANVNLKWLERSLRVGQRLTVTIVDATHIDEPTSRQREDPAWVEQRKREYYERLKREYGDA